MKERFNYDETSSKRGIARLSRTWLRPIWFKDPFGLIGGCMEQVDQYAYYELGSTVAQLRAALPESSAKAFSDLILPIIAAQNVLEKFRQSPFIHARAAAADVNDRLQELWDVAKGGLDDEGRPTFNFEMMIESWRVSSLKTSLRDLESILAREAPTLPIFFLPQKGLARTEQLVNNAEDDFAPSLRSVVTQYPRVIEEIRQAGKALAFDLFTARAFHIMRAVEVLLLELLDKYGAKPDKESQRNLGNYVDILKKNGADTELTRFLDEMVRVERNESIHPTRLFDEAQADMIYSIAKSAITALVAELAKGSVELPSVPEAQMKLNGISTK